MKSNLYIITGASRGLGLAMAEQLLSQGHHLLCISRNKSDRLAQLAMDGDGVLYQWALDLADAQHAAQCVGLWLRTSELNEFDGITLINNAGLIPAIAPLSDTDGAEIARVLRVGLEAPMLMAAEFLRHTETACVPRKVLNISSGLGRRPMASQSAYCAAKAGLDHFTRCLALDEARKPNGAKVCALAPGVVDTDMQVQLRSANPDQFPDQSRFTQLQLEGQLSSPQEAAKRVLAWLDRSDFGSQVVADVRS